MHMRVAIFWAVALILRTGLLAQSPAGGDGVGTPSEYSLRLTPGMARGMAREFVRDEFMRHYEIDKSREGDISEMVARRVMAGAHAIDTEEGQAASERVMTTMLDALAEGRRQGMHAPVFTPELARTFGRDMTMLMPHVRRLVRDVAQDVRPEMSMKQQLKFAGELVAVNAAMDGFEAVAKRWSNGEFAPGDDPFRGDRGSEIQLDEDGASQDLKRARKLANKQDPFKNMLSRWERYVKDANAFYGFDNTQSATADSVLREIKSRAEDLARNPQAKSRRYESSLWRELSWVFGQEFRLYQDSPLEHLMSRATRADDEARSALDTELKDRIEKIPRADQRRKADQQLDAKLAALGMEPEAATQPAGGNADAK